MEAWLAAQDELAARAGVTLSDEEVDILCTLTIPETAEFLHVRFGVGDSPAEVVDTINTLMGGFYASKAKARPGALDFVRKCHERGVKTSVASSTPQALLQAGLGNAHFTEYLDAVVSVDDVGASKREPAVFFRAQELMGTEQASTWVMEDSVYAIRTARDAGYPTIGIYDQDVAGTWQELSIATLAIKEFSDLDTEAFLSDPYSYSIG